MASLGLLRAIDEIVIVFGAFGWLLIKISLSILPARNALSRHSLSEIGVFALCFLRFGLLNNFNLIFHVVIQ